MFKLDNKGQSSSVFNLLIAALVSLAILGLLLSVLGGINPFTDKNPSEVAITQLKNAQQNPYSAYSDEIKFSKKYPSLNTTSLSEKLDVGEDGVGLKVCGDVSEDFEPNEGENIRYSGTADKKYTATAICGTADLEEKHGVPTDCGSLSTEDQFKCYIVITQFKG
jgi:hypothetical protein